MTFAGLPWWTVLIAALVAGLITLVLYLLRRTPRVQIVSNVEFWARAAQQANPRLLAALRIPWLAFFVTLLISLLLAFNLGDPRFGKGVRGTTVIVVAAGSSMAAEHYNKQRIEEALEEVQSWVQRATSRGKVAVVRAGIRPSVLLPLTEHAMDLEAALEGFEIDEGEADLAGAVRLADDIIHGSGDAGQILVVGDVLPDVQSTSPQALVPVGYPGDNIAITALSARRDPQAVGEYTVWGEASSFTSRLANARLVVRDRDVVILDEAIEIQPGETVRFTAQGFSNAQAEVTASLKEIRVAGSHDGLELDNVAHAVVSPFERVRVLLVTPGNTWLEGALSSHPGVTLETTSPQGASGDGFDVVILDRAAPAGFTHPAQLMIGVDVSGALPTGESLRRPDVTASLASHRALSGVRLDRVRVSSAKGIITEPGDQVLLRSGSHAIGVARERSGQRVVAYGFTLNNTDLVQRPAFPLMLHHTLRWLAGRKTPTLLPSATGEPLVAAASESVVDQNGETLELEQGRLEAVTKAGIYRAGERAIAFRPSGEPGSLPAVAARSTNSLTSSLPPLGVLIACGLAFLMLAEWFFFHRGKLA